MLYSVQQHLIWVNRTPASEKHPHAAKLHNLLTDFEYLHSEVLPRRSIPGDRGWTRCRTGSRSSRCTTRFFWANLKHKCHVTNSSAWVLPSTNAKTSQTGKKMTQSKENIPKSVTFTLINTLDLSTLIYSSTTCMSDKTFFFLLAPLFCILYVWMLLPQDLLWTTHHCAWR